MNEKKIDIVLTDPPYSLKENFGLLDFVGYYGPPVNLLYLGASLEKAGFNVEITEQGGDWSLEDFAGHIVSLGAPVIGVSVHFTFLSNKSLRLISLIKQLKPEVKIIAGGVHFTTLSMEIMKANPSIDVGIMGEADEAIVEVASQIRAGRPLSEIKGIIFRKGTELVRTSDKNLIPDLNRLPYPLIDRVINRYSFALYKGKGIDLFIFTSRGCPYLCTFCDRTVLGSTVRFYSVEYLSRMIDTMAQLYGVKTLEVLDENMCLTRERFNEICALFREKHEKYGLTWTCSIKADSVEASTGKILYDSGCRAVTFGIESGSREMLAVYKKSLNLNSLPEKCRLLRSAGVTLSGSFIIGGPGESVKTIQETVELIKRIDLDFLFLWYFIPYTGASIYKDIEKKGALLGDYSTRTGHHVAFVPATITEQELESGYRKIYRTFYMKPRVIYRTMKRFGITGIFRFAKYSLKYAERFLLKK